VLAGCWWAVWGAFKIVYVLTLSVILSAPQGGKQKGCEPHHHYTSRVVVEVVLANWLLLLLHNNCPIPIW
jgi:hypothetical protein